MILYGELTKLEPQADGSIKVYGVASTGARDTAGEVVLPEAMRQALPAYLAFGAIREMHQACAAGAALSAEVDAGGVTRIEAHIVDPVAVKKVQAGVYKGLSIGGKVLGRDPADASVITRLRLDEISLVDRPCNPDAVIDLWKAAPTVPTNAEVKAEADRLARVAGRPGRRNDFLAKAREGLMARAETHPSPLIPANAGTQIIALDDGRVAPDLRSPPTPAGAPYDLGPGLRRDERSEDGPHQHPEGDLAKIADLERALADAGALADSLAKRVDLQAEEIQRLRRQPLPPRAAGSHLAKAIAKDDDVGGNAEARFSPDDLARALDAMAPADRAHLLMKAALARPISL